MRRQRRMHHTENESSHIRHGSSRSLSGNTEDFAQMEDIRKLPSRQAHRFENTIEAKVEVGDTLQALALRFHCTVADIKRLNKIDKDNEIHARKIVKIPVTVHTVLLNTLPTVHTSGNSSPKHAQDQEPNITRNPLEDARNMLDEKLLVASVNAAGVNPVSNVRSDGGNNVNRIVLNSKLASSRTPYTDEDVPQPSSSNRNENGAKLPLISDILEDESIPHIRQIPGPSTLAIDWSGSDCDMSWICLFIVILALCVVIPLIYVIYIAENPHHHHHHHQDSAAHIPN